MPKPTFTSSLIFEDHENYAQITLNRPEKLNSFSVDMRDALSDALQHVAGSKEFRALILTGAGRGFCAGQDLNERKMESGGPPIDLSRSVDILNSMIELMRSMPVPIIAAVNGVAAGAGASLALASDIAVASRSAAFVQAFGKVGLIPDGGSTWFLPRLIGDARARGLTLLGNRLDAETAARWGLIWECVDDHELMERAHELARHFSASAPLAMMATKQALHATQTNSLSQQLKLERELQTKLGLSDDYREGVQSFLERRPAVFKNR